MILLGLYTTFVSILVIMVVQLIISIILWGKIKKINTKIETIQLLSTETEETADPPYVTKEKKDKQTTIETPKTPVFTEDIPKASQKEQVLEVLQTLEDAESDNLPSIVLELKRYFSLFMNENYIKNLSSKAYYHFIDLRDKPDTRVVVIGDIHCDYYSLSAILIKLSTSSYDYFKNAIFVFLGDYLDRGAVLFEPLLLLKRLKEILGDRMIMLKGNHESVSYNNTKQQIETRVRPDHSCNCLNNYCGRDKEFLCQFASFYSTLPTYVYLRIKDKNVLLTHAGIPRDLFYKSFHLDESTGEIILDESKSESDLLRIRNAILKDMIWGDPKNYEEKIQFEGRFEFGSKQYERFAIKNQISLLLRSHEEASYGYKPFFKKQLYTIFSTGGGQNPQTDYHDVEPAFAIIDNEYVLLENSFIYKIKKDFAFEYLNPFSMQKYTSNHADNFMLNKEFICEEDQIVNIQSLFKKLKEIFNDN